MGPTAPSLPPVSTGMGQVVAWGGLWPTDPRLSHREDPVEPQAEAKFRLDFVPHQSGLRKLMVDFESDKLTGVKGYRNVIIAPLPK